MDQTLLAMQRHFLDTLRNRDKSGTDNILAQKVVSAPGLKAYRHAYSSRLVEALENDHPVLGKYLGDELWQRMAVAYIEKHPSRFRSLRNFGDMLPAYLADCEEYKSHPEIAELAQLERKLLDCFDACDAETTGFSEFLELRPEQWAALKLAFHPSLQLLDHQFNSVAVWQNMKEQQPPPALIRNRNSWLLWRDCDRITNYKSLSDDERTAFSHFIEGGNFSGFCEKLAVFLPAEMVPTLALGFLKSWSDQDLVIAVITD